MKPDQKEFKVLYENPLKSELLCLDFAFHYITDCQHGSKQVLEFPLHQQTGVQKYTHRSLSQSYASQVSTYYKHLKKGAHQSHLCRQNIGWFLAD